MAFGTGVRKVLQWREQHVQSSEVGSTLWVTVGRLGEGG